MSSPSSFEENMILYIPNIAQQYDEESVKEFFQPIGVVTRIEMSPLKGSTQNGYRSARVFMNWYYTEFTKIIQDCILSGDMKFSFQLFEDDDKYWTLMKNKFVSSGYHHNPYQQTYGNSEPFFPPKSFANAAASTAASAASAAAALPPDAKSLAAFPPISSKKTCDALMVPTVVMNTKSQSPSQSPSPSPTPSKTPSPSPTSAAPAPEQVAEKMEEKNDVEATVLETAFESNVEKVVKAVKAEKLVVEKQVEKTVTFQVPVFQRRQVEIHPEIIRLSAENDRLTDENGRLTEEIRRNMETVYQTTTEKRKVKKLELELSFLKSEIENYESEISYLKNFIQQKFQSLE
jgi:hypothetical protein